MYAYTSSSSRTDPSPPPEKSICVAPDEGACTYAPLPLCRCTLAPCRTGPRSSPSPSFCAPRVGLAPPVAHTVRRGRERESQRIICFPQTSAIGIPASSLPLTKQEWGEGGAGYQYFSAPRRPRSPRVLCDTTGRQSRQTRALDMAIVPILLHVSLGKPRCTL